MGQKRSQFQHFVCQCPFGLLFISTNILFIRQEKINQSVNAHSGFSSFPLKICVEMFRHLFYVSMPIRASLHFHSTLLKAAEIKHFPDLFCRYLSENSENRNFQNHFCPVHNLFIFYSVAGTIRSYSCNTIFF